MTLLALRVISRRRSNSVAFGAKRTWPDSHSQSRAHKIGFMSTRPNPLPHAQTDRPLAEAGCVAAENDDAIGVTLRLDDASTLCALPDGKADSTVRSNIRAWG
jgi:hypothetical protein